MTASEFGEAQNERELIQFSLASDFLSDAVRRALMGEARRPTTEIDLDLVVPGRYDPSLGKFTPTRPDQAKLFQSEVFAAFIGVSKPLLKGLLAEVNLRKYRRNFRKLGLFKPTTDFDSAYANRVWQYHCLVMRDRKNISDIVEKLLMGKNGCPKRIPEFWEGLLPFGRVIPWQAEEGE